jgi:hypothetical protein
MESITRYVIFSQQKSMRPFTSILASRPEICLYSLLGFYRVNRIEYPRENILFLQIQFNSEGHVLGSQ